MIFKKFKCYHFLFLAFLLILVTGCTAKEDSSKPSKDSSNEEKVLKIAIAGEAARLDPHWASSGTELPVIFPIFNSLVRFPPGTTDVANIEGDLAKSWEANEEATEWTFYLKKGIQWHNGYGELTSKDIKWSFERVMDPESGSAWLPDVEGIASIETPDDYTVVFKLRRPDSSFLLTTSNYHAGWIVKKEAIEDAGENYLSQPVGTGPFMFESYETNEKITLVKNPDYFRGEPKLDKIEFHIMPDPTAMEIAIDKGEIHLAPGISDKLWVENRQKNSDLIIDFPGPSQLAGLHLNTSKEPFNDPLIREAISHAIDQKLFVEEIVGTDIGSVPAGPVPSTYFGAVSVGINEYDPEKAKELLAEAGYPNGIKLPAQDMTTNPVYTDKIVYIQEQLRNVGIDMPLEQVDHATYHANIRKDLNEAVLIWSTLVPHAGNYLSQFFYGPSSIGTPTASYNFSHFDKADDLIEQATNELDPDKQIELFEEIQRMIIEENVFIPLAEDVKTYQRRKEVDLGYDDFTGSLIYGFPITEETDLK